MTAVTPLDTLYDPGRGPNLPLPPELASLYGRLQFPPHPERPYVVANFVTTLDGVVSLRIPGKEGGGDISGHNEHDQMVMGLLRAVADAVVVGAGTLRATPDRLWTPEDIYPALAPAYEALRAALGKSQPPLHVFVTAHGEVDLDRPVFRSGQVPVLIVTTPEGRQRIDARHPAPVIHLAEVTGPAHISAKAILEAVNQVVHGDLILVEGGPHLIADFFAEHCLDEQFLTLAPQVAGRDGSSARPGLVEGKLFAPEHPLWGTLVGIKRGGSHLFLRYAFESALRGPASAR